MKKLIPFLFVMVEGNVRGQTYYPCSVLPSEFQQWCYTAVYLDTFNIAEDSALIVIDTTNTCTTWDKGHSYKTVFDSATSPYGLVTDTLLPYATGVKCSFIVKQPMEWFFYPTLLFFEHKFDNDSLLDGGYIEYSCDHGINWRYMTRPDWQQNQPPLMINFHNYAGLPNSYYNSNMPALHDTIPAFTGTNGDWQWSGVQFVWTLPVMRPDENRWQECYNTDSMFYRFTFESDNIDNARGGWMVRNIVAGWNDIGGSVSEFSSQPLKIFPNPASEKVSIELPPNSGKLSSIVISDIAGNVALRATDAREIDFSTLSPGIYFVLAETDKFVFRQKFVKQ